MVIHDKNAGIIISGSSLVLQGVSRKMSGLYSCVASNIEGDTQSNTLELKVMCKWMLRKIVLICYITCLYISIFSNKILIKIYFA